MNRNSSSGNGKTKPWLYSIKCGGEYEEENDI